MLAIAGWLDGGGVSDGVCQLLRHQGDAANHRLQVQGRTNGPTSNFQLVSYKVLSVLYQYENLTEDLDESGEKKKSPGGEKKVLNC